MWQDYNVYDNIAFGLNLLRLIAGFQTASEGEIKISGKEITQTPPHKRPVNTVFQKYALFPHLTEENAQADH